MLGGCCSTTGYGQAGSRADSCKCFAICPNSIDVFDGSRYSCMRTEGARTDRIGGEWREMDGACAVGLGIEGLEGLRSDV